MYILTHTHTDTERNITKNVKAFIKYHLSP